MPLTAPFSWVQLPHASLYKSSLTRAVCLTLIYLVFSCSAFPVHVRVFELFCLIHDLTTYEQQSLLGAIDNQRPLTSRVETLHHSPNLHQHSKHGESRALRVYYHAYGVDSCIAYLPAPCHDRAAGQQQQSSIDIPGARPVLFQGTPTTTLNFSRPTNDIAGRHK